MFMPRLKMIFSGQEPRVGTPFVQVVGVIGGRFLIKRTHKLKELGVKT